MTGSDRGRALENIISECGYGHAGLRGKKFEKRDTAAVWRMWGRGWDCYGKNTGPVEGFSRIGPESEGKRCPWNRAVSEQKTEKMITWS